MFSINLHSTKTPLLCSILVFLPLAVAAVPGMGPLFLETTPGSALTVIEPGGGAGGYEVRSMPMRATSDLHQRWIRNSARGVWSSAALPNQCLAFADAAGESLTVSPCANGTLLYSDLKSETRRELKFRPTPSAAVDTSNRDAVLAFYNSQYSAGNPPPDIGFTGDVPSCNAGTTSAAFRAAVAQRFNFLRNLAGLGNVTQDDALSGLAQASALMQAANNSLSHTPPNTWLCYTDAGAGASAKSNLYQGQMGWGAVEGYINEADDLGHRRWVLFPALQRFGTGDIPGTTPYNALYVITGDAPPATITMRDGFTAWPPKGFVPYKFAFPVWSFSLAGADFSGATVAVTDGTGANVPVTNAKQLANGYGDNTYSFTPALPLARPTPGGPDVPYTVTVSNVAVNGGAPQNFTYTVTLFDVVDPPTDLQFAFGAIQTPLPANSVFGNLTVVDGQGGNGYTFTLVTGAGSDDNALFTVNGAQLMNVSVVDFSTKTTFNVRLKADNGRQGGSIEKAIVINSPFM